MSARFNDGQRVAIAQRLSSSTEVLGVLLHGSCATGTSDSASDVDLISVASVPRSTRLITTINGLRIDLYSSSPSEVEKAIRADLRTNNNSTLYGFVKGRTIIDRGGHVARLKVVAGNVWKAGPRRPSLEESGELDKWFLSVSTTVDRIRLRSSRSAEWRGNGGASFRYCACRQFV
jgi:predicted nucleotidyltransferase